MVEEVCLLPKSRFSQNKFFFIIIVGTESYSVNSYSCHLRGDIRVPTAIETDSGSTYCSNPLCKLRKKNHSLRGEPGSLELGLR